MSLNWHLRRYEFIAEPIDNSHSQLCADIHAQTFSRSWTDGEIGALLSSKGCFGFVVRPTNYKPGSLIGFVLARKAGDEAEILTIAIQPKWQGYGAGQQLMLAVLTYCRQEDIGALFLEVDENNKSACALYKRCGFREVGARKNYYSDTSGTKSSALVMRRDVG